MPEASACRAPLRWAGWLGERVAAARAKTAEEVAPWRERPLAAAPVILAEIPEERSRSRSSAQSPWSPTGGADGAEKAGDSHAADRHCVD